jgi:hypothetical protein
LIYFGDKLGTQFTKIEGGYTKFITKLPSPIKARA